MDAEFFGLAFLAALNPKLLAIDLLLIENRRPRLMFTAFLAGGLAMGITIGLLDVFVLQVGAVRSQGSVSAGLELGIGAALMVVGGLIATRRLPRKRVAATPPDPPSSPKKEGWAERILREPRPALAVVVGLLAGTPGATYITALIKLVGSGDSLALQALGVVLFQLIQFSVVIVPLLFLEFRPEATARGLRGTNAWIGRHARQVIAGLALAVGLYMVISGITRLV